MHKYLIRAVQFTVEGDVIFEYMEPLRDIRQNDLTMHHTLIVPGDDEYDDEIEALREAAMYLLGDALEDFGRMPPVMPPPPDEDEDDE